MQEMSHVDPDRQCVSQLPPAHETSHVEPAWHSVLQLPPGHEMSHVVLLLQVVLHDPPGQETSHDVPEAHEAEGPPSRDVFPVLQSYMHAPKKRLAMAPAILI